MVWTIRSVLVSLVALAVTFWYLSYLWKRRKLYFYSWNVPGPFALPVIGAGYMFLGSSDDILGKIYKIVQANSDLTKVWLGTRLIYSTVQLNHIEKILTSQKCMGKDSLYRFITYIVGTGLLTAPTQKWRKHRKVISPSFNQKILDSFVDIFAEQTSIFNELMEEYAGRKDVDIHKALTALALDNICETAMGLKMNTQKGSSTFANDLEKSLEIAALRVFNIWHHLDWTWRFYPTSREFDKHVAGLRTVTSTVIKMKMEAFEARKSNSSSVAEIEEGEHKRKMAFLDLVIETSDFTEVELTEEIEIFLVAGTDTSGTTLSFIFEMLGLFPDVQQKLYEEVIDVLGEDRPVESSDLPKFKYMERVIKETMRLFPVGVYFLRTVEEDIDLGKYILPEGAAVFVSLLNIHRDPKCWPEPLRFDPDRFLPEEVAKRHPCSYIPFSYGPRNCIGAKYAMMSMKTVTAMAIRKYRMFTRYESVEDIQLISKTLLRPKHGFKVYLELR